MKKEIRALLAQRNKRHIDAPRRIPSAVLVPLRRRNGSYYILFIRRSLTVKTHKGQISFPGGTLDAADATLLETALRECDEEIGLNPADADVLGELDDEVTATSNYIVTPYVAEIPGEYDFRLNPDEVDEIIEVPLGHLLRENSRKPAAANTGNELLDSYSYQHQDRVIWGATARILRRFLNILAALQTQD